MNALLNDEQKKYCGKFNRCSAKISKLTEAKETEGNIYENNRKMVKNRRLR